MRLATLHDFPNDRAQWAPLSDCSIARRPRVAKHSAGAIVTAHKKLRLTLRSVTQGRFMFRSRSLRATQMLTEARAWADELTLLEMQHPTEPLEDVWRRLERKTGVSFGTFWSLRWRFNQLKDIWASNHSLLRDALKVERDGRARRNQLHKQIARAKRVI